MVAVRNIVTPAEYLRRERAAETKSEYVNGQIYAMSGASRQHNRITVNVTALLHTQLQRSPCEAFANDMRVKVSAESMYTYPDLAVVCGEAKFEDTALDTLLNPTLIIEVLSDSTEKYDRGKKFAYYQRIESLREYVLISQDTPRIESFTRLPDNRWVLTTVEVQEEAISLASIGCSLPLSDVYARVEFEKEAANEPSE